MPLVFNVIDTDDCTTLCLKQKCVWLLFSWRLVGYVQLKIYVVSMENIKVYFSEADTCYNLSTLGISIKVIIDMKKSSEPTQ